MLARTNCWVTTREAGDPRHRKGHMASLRYCRQIARCHMSHDRTQLRSSIMHVSSQCVVALIFISLYTISISHPNTLTVHLSIHRLVIISIFTWPACDKGKIYLALFIFKWTEVLGSPRQWVWHYDDVIMTILPSQITSLTVVYSIVYSGVDERKHQSSASLAFVRGIHRDRWIPRTKGQ